MDVRTIPGDVYFMSPDHAVVYDAKGIALRLTGRNLANIERARKTLEVIRDEDSMRRRFNVAYDQGAQQFRFEPTKGETVRSPAWLFETAKAG